jgi:hypothetical protein
MKTGKIICNVGGLIGNGESTAYAAFLAQFSDNQFAIVILKDAATINGVAYPKGFGLISKEVLTSLTTNTIPQSILNRLAVNITPSLSEEAPSYARFAPGVFNETAIVALTTTAYGIATLAACPAPYTIKGAFVSQSVVDDLAGTDVLAEPANTGTGGGTIIVPTTSNAQNLLPAINENLTGSISAAFSSPVEYAKANPISAGIMVVGLAEVGSMLGFWKFSPLKKISKILK